MRLSRTERLGLKTERPDFRPERPSLRPERPESPDLRPEKPDMRPDLRPERPDFRPDWRPERPDFRPLRPDQGGGRTNERTDGQTNKSPPVFYRTSSPSGPLPKKRTRPETIT